jgi:hypothetical protein
MHHHMRRRSLFWIAPTSLGAIGLLGCTTAAPTISPATIGCEWRLASNVPSSAGMQILSATTQALYSVGSADSSGRGYVLLARGQPNWFVGKLVGGGGHIDDVGRRDHAWRGGNRTFKVSYDPGTNTADLFGKHIWLDTANVLFLDRVDGVGGEPQLVGTACLHGFDTGSPDGWLRSASPAVQAFVKARPDA